MDEGEREAPRPRPPDPERDESMYSPHLPAPADESTDEAMLPNAGPQAEPDRLAKLRHIRIGPRADVRNMTRAELFRSAGQFAILFIVLFGGGGLAAALGGDGKIRGAWVVVMIAYAFALWYALLGALYTFLHALFRKPGPPAHGR